MAGWLMIALAFGGQAVVPASTFPQVEIARSQPCGPRFQPMAIRLDEVRPRALQRVQPGARREMPRRPVPLQPCYRLAVV